MRPYRRGRAVPRQHFAGQSPEATTGAIAHDSAADLLAGGQAEAAVLAGVSADQSLAALATMVPVVVIKRGPAGVVASGGSETVERPALDVDVVDTTGAGDAFSAGFLPAWLAGMPLAAALDAGQDLAARAVGRVGASPMVG